MPRRLLVFGTLLLASVLVVGEGVDASPLVFDFESDLQGWNLGTVERVDGAPLGGDFAVFGRGLDSGADLPEDIDPEAPGPSMSLQLDLTGYGELTFWRLHVSPSDPVRDFVLVSIHPVGVPCGFACLQGGSSLISTPEDPEPNPDLRLIDLSSFVGVQQVDFVWITVNGTGYSGYVDDITFHPVPEPSGALPILVAVLLCGLYARRRGCGPTSGCT